jgi:hypothetical protein
MNMAFWFQYWPGIWTQASYDAELERLGWFYESLCLRN